MRCYFDLVNGAESIFDDTGITVPDLETAQGEALRAIQEMREEVGDPGAEWQGWRLNVVGAEGHVLLSISLGTLAEPVEAMGDIGMHTKRAARDL